MTVRRNTVHTKKYPTFYITELSPINRFIFIMVAYPGHILESTTRVEIKLATYRDVNERKYRRQEP